MGIQMPQSPAPAFADDTNSKFENVRLPDWFAAVNPSNEVLARAVLKLDQMARDRGVWLYPQTDFWLLKKVVAQHRSMQAGLTPQCDPEFNLLTPENSFWIVGRDESGRVVTTQATRLFDWSTTNLKVEAESLRFFYADPGRQARDGDELIMDCEGARRITGRCIQAGTVWVHPDRRGADADGVNLSQILARITRFSARSRWDHDFTFSFVRNRLIESGLAERFGYPNVEPGISLKLPDFGVVHCHLVWMNRDELIEDARLTVEGILRRPLAVRAA